MVVTKLDLIKERDIQRGVLFLFTFEGCIFIWQKNSFIYTWTQGNELNENVYIDFIIYGRFDLFST